MKKVIGVNGNESRSTRRIGMSDERRLKCVDGVMSMERDDRGNSRSREYMRVCG